MLEAPPLVVRHATSRGRLRETLLKDPPGQGFAMELTAATVFHDKACDIWCVVHGEDFTFLGRKECLNDVREGIKAKYEVRGVLGGE